MTETSKLSFSATHLIVLDAIDPQTEQSTADMLVNNLGERFDDADRKLATAVVPIPNRRAFDTELAAILRLAEQGALPTIHFDGHAAKDGLRAANKEFYPWSSMWKHLAQINLQCRNNLTITMGVCKGLHSILDSAFTILEPAPAFAIVAAQNPVSPDTVCVGFELYFEMLFRTGDVSAAFRELKTIDKQRDGDLYGDFRLCTAQAMFEEFARKYIQHACMGTGGLERKKRLIAEGNFIGPEKRKARKLLRQKLRRSQALPLARYHEHFMMVDKYPELRPRLGLAIRWGIFERNVRNERRDHRRGV